MCTISLWSYVLLTLLSTSIGALGAIVLDSKAIQYVYENTPGHEISRSKKMIEAWKKKLILALIASACTPLFLDLMKKCDSICCSDSTDFKYIMYFGYALILATFGELFVTKLRDLISGSSKALNNLFK